MGRKQVEQHLKLPALNECSKDKELFPDGYFVSQKCNLKQGKNPCGCSKKPEWEDWQYIIITRRAAKGRFIVHGFAEEYRGAHTKLNLECLKDGYKWITSIDKIINNPFFHVQNLQVSEATLYSS